MIKRRFPLLLILTIVLFLTSCSGNHKSKTDNNTLTIMGRKSDMEKSYMTSIFEQYENAAGNKLDIIEFDDAEFEVNAAKKFADGDAPDIFMHFNNADLNRFDVANNFYYLNNESWVSDLTDSSLAYCQDKEGNLLGLPFWESSVSGCFYNKTLLDSLGLKPATTQAEFDVLCQVLADIGHTPICWPADGCTWMFQFGMDPIFADDPSLLEKLNKNEISYSDIPAVANMVKWVSDAADKGWFGSEYLENGWSDISTIMGSGKAVMTFIWDTWFYTDFEQGNKYTVDDFALMPAFMNTADSGTYEGGNLNMMMVNKNSKKLDKALGFLSFCADAKNYNIAFDGISTVSCFKGQTTNIQSPMVTNASTSIASNERVSTAASKIIGYSADDMSAAFDRLFNKKTDVAGCVKLMDDYRIKEAEKQGKAVFQ